MDTTVFAVVVIGSLTVAASIVLVLWRTADMVQAWARKGSDNGGQ